MDKKLLYNNCLSLKMIACIALISIFIISLLGEASARETENTDDISVQESPVQQPPKQKQHIDPFNLAIVGISLGCMLFAASVGRNRMHRRELETQIQGLDSFLTSSCAVGFRINVNGCNDNDPMMNSVKDIQNGRDMKLKEYEEHKTVMVRSISDVEAEIMRILG